MNTGGYSSLYRTGTKGVGWVEDVDVPEPSPGDVRVKVRAAGICGSDIPRIYENGAHKMPLIPGHEFSGVVEGIGKDASTYWMGRRVGVYPLIPCRECDSCKRGLYEMCRNYDYIGSRRDGAFAEYVTVPVDNLIELPESVSYEEAAMLEPMAVAANAVRKGTNGFLLNKESPVVVCGLGTIGLFVAMFLKDAGYQNIYGIGNKPGQKERLISLGIGEDHYLDSHTMSGHDLFSSPVLSGLAGKVAAYFECVGKNQTIAQGVELSAPDGRVVLVGNPYSDMNLPRDTYWKILRNQLTVFGVWNSRFNGNFDDDWHYVLDRLKEKRINPAAFTTHRLPLEDLDKGLVVMKDKTEDYCKVMAVME